MQADPDYRYLLSLAQHLRTLGARTSISLSRPQREREQAEVEQFRLTLENNLRAAKNMPLFENFSALEKDKSPDNATEAPDAMLDEAANIMIDYINQPAQAAGRLTGRTKLRCRCCRISALTSRTITSSIAAKVDEVVKSQKCALLRRARKKFEGKACSRRNAYMPYAA